MDISAEEPLDVEDVMPVPGNGPSPWIPPRPKRVIAPQIQHSPKTDLPLAPMELRQLTVPVDPTDIVDPIKREQNTDGLTAAFAMSPESINLFTRNTGLISINFRLGKDVVGSTDLTMSKDTRVSLVREFIQWCR